MTGLPSSADQNTTEKIEYRIEYTDHRGLTRVKKWVECDESMGRAAAYDAIRSMGFFHWPNVTVRKRITTVTESVAWSANRPEFINDHLPKDQR